jgi:hypothetical protein
LRIGSVELYQGAQLLMNLIVHRLTHGLKAVSEDRLVAGDEGRLLVVGQPALEELPPQFVAELLQDAPGVLQGKLERAVIVAAVGPLRAERIGQLRQRDSLGVADTVFLAQANLGESLEGAVETSDSVVEAAFGGATAIRVKYGLEAARILLGHCSALVTEAVYAERDEQAAMRIAAEAG